MSQISEEEIEKAREMDLLTYLQTYEPQELVPCGNSSYKTKSHDSLKLSNGKWYWWSHGIGGITALDYLVKVRDIPFPDAVAILTKGGPIPAPPPKETESPQFELPPRHANNRRVFAYLAGRGIDPQIISFCIHSGFLYEDEVHHNCVFIGYENDTPRYGACRGTLSDRRYVGEIPGSDKRYSFSLPIHPRGETLCVFESAIDALSYLSLLKLSGADWRRANCLSLAGVYQPKDGSQMKFPAALERYLQDNPAIRKIVLCLDNDEVGRNASKAIADQLDGYEVTDLPPKAGKDYNDLLQMKTGLKDEEKHRDEMVR